MMKHNFLFIFMGVYYLCQRKLLPFIHSRFVDGNLPNFPSPKITGFPSPKIIINDNLRFSLGYCLKLKIEISGHAGEW